ncbi:ras-specific guanine nucleotide-releasing factor 2-like isoform X2 [Ptychodera flava]|uniref:ras-specific guanine nucleotide-releasing factor 2-like isoform X2 n=1 Tax=Ptychodera flava TaxID=63121 RepID=UPI003969BB4A
MQKAIRLNENQLLNLASKARTDHTVAGYLYKKSADTGKWQQRWFALYQNLLFYYENDSTTKLSGVALLEGCYCERLTLSKKDNEKQFYCFSIGYRREGQRQYDLRAETETEYNTWVNAIKQASFRGLLQQKEELEHKYLHLLQILDSEKTAKLSLRQQCEEQIAEIAKLKFEINELKKQESKEVFGITYKIEESEDIKKIKKVQSFIRGWLCRRRWRAIVQDYIRSPHAESMRKRNSIVFGMVECEKEYVEQLSTVVSCFLRPLKMAASSKKPPITHEDVNSIFLNSETVFFLHQIFCKGLCARMEHWPKLVLGDLFDMLLPMLSIYNEYVRNHHYSLQVLAECKQNSSFSHLLAQYESKPVCEGRSLETFLTYPMHQIPRYIITLHELLAHTPHDHVERKSLEHAKNKLEELSRVMHDEVSETENIRKNLAIERMIVEGCDILLDVNQTFVRQGTLIQALAEKGKSRSRLGSLSSSKSDSKKEGVRQCFLFTHHLLITTRGSAGRLHLAKIGGKIALIDTMLVDDFDPFDDDEGSVCSHTSQSDYDNLELKLLVDSKSGPPLHVILIAPTQQEKNAWMSDISQCIDNLHYNGLLNGSLGGTHSSLHMPLSIRSDPRLFKDDIDIRFSRTLNSCKVPQIRYASVERLLERLTDLRFLSIDFLNTFLLTYHVFTTGKIVIETLKKVYRDPEAMETLYNLKDEHCSGTSETSRTQDSQQSTSQLKSLETTSNMRTFPSRKSFSRYDRAKDVWKVDGEQDFEKGGEAKDVITTTTTTTTTISPESNVSEDSTPTNSPPSTPTMLSQSDGYCTLAPMRSKLPISRSAPNIAALVKARPGSSFGSDGSTSPRNSVHQFENPVTTAVTAGVVVTSSRQSKRRSSTSAAATAFAVATAAACNPRDAKYGKGVRRHYSAGPADRKPSLKRKESVISTAATMRVINVMRHWVSKYAQDFISDETLKAAALEFLDEVVGNGNLLASEHKAAASVLRTLHQELSEADSKKSNWGELLTVDPDYVSVDDMFDHIAALDLAEQLTYLDHKLFTAIPYEEFLSQSWMKADKDIKAPHIMAVTRRFNEVSKLVASEIIRQPNLQARASSIEKWAAVADICRCMHNYNGVLEITSALMNSAVYRLKKAWDKVSKQTKAMLEKLQLVVSSEGRFKNMREALHRIDPPCIPYLGFYLTDLAFIEDATPNITEGGLVNFSKMRMRAHVIREIRHFQQTHYKIEPDRKILNYLLDTERIMDDDELYALSLEIEPRQPRPNRVSSSM